ncbi:FAD synthetase [Pseudothermotoga thermarum]|uniref:FAD synthase n=1 Tax=Pseudothermotoga thermarum DSM 5069 TaxID=688269 RepID=F7YYL9_9THEM|nr:FAD synthetase [Pseudothermotoga thermarum]AEH51051.1 FAD synthetase [Pseudothermotoga thermarum DSM 5069]
MKKYVTTIGVFDGVHIGHQALFKFMKKIGCEKSLPLKVFVVSYPYEYLQGRFDGFIIPLKIRIGEILKYVDEVEILDLSRIKDLDPDEFFYKYISDQTAVLVVGKDFRFGKNAAGTVETLKNLSSEAGIEFFSFDLVMNGSFQKVSSSEIRQFIKSGQIDKVTQLLGRPLILELLVIGTTTQENVFLVKQKDELVKLGNGVYNVEEYYTGKKGLLKVKDMVELVFNEKLLPSSLLTFKVTSKVDQN